MLETFFLTVHGWLTGNPGIALLGSFSWGMLSVLFSPCHLASIPLIIAYVGGQQKILAPREAVYYAVSFSGGLFLSIAIIGLVTAWLGRMLGDVGNYWQILVGLILIWVALGMLGVKACSVSGGFLYKLNLRGLVGAWLLGLLYGILSGSCTFGFIAPILAVITIQKEVMNGVLLILLFALGHCLPIVIAGSFSAGVRRILAHSTWQDAGNWFRRGAGVVVGVLGLYFITNPFITIL